MSDDKVYTPEVIQDSAFPQEETVDSTVTQVDNKDVVSSPTTEDHPFPTKLIAVETIGSALNTKSRKILAEFEFAGMGAIQVGKYENGVSGDVRITPNGITARDLSGLITFALNGEDGSAVFKGSIQSGSIITGEVVVGNNSVVIDGENHRILVYDDDGIPQILIGYLANGF